MLKLKLPHFGHLMRRTDSLENTLILGKIESGRRRGQQRMKRSDGITNSMDNESEQAPVVGDGQGSLACCSPWGCKELDMTDDRTEVSSCPVLGLYYSFRGCALSPSCPTPNPNLWPLIFQERKAENDKGFAQNDI